MASLLRAFGFVVLLVATSSVFADPAQFDLAGPKLEVNVTHGGKTLPISEVPNISEGDQLWIKADLPPAQSVHYLLVAAFLRGATNPPPENWFYPLDTWTDRGREGLKITVPADAQQVLVFLAPETGGDFKTLVGAVRGRPGAFVRASQDLNQATLDRSRLDAYLTAIRKIGQTDPERLRTASPLLARSLTIKLEPECLQKMPELQAPCLTQGQDALVLSDGHSTSIVQALTSGLSADLAMQLSSTAQAGFGYYSPYISSAMDIARIMETFHTAQYQYIPALATEQGDRLALQLNMPPSFHNPKSVLVIALPAVEPPQMPPLHPVNPKEVYCAEKTELVLPADGAPLVFSTGYAHDMVLRLKGKNGKLVDLPVKADAVEGGFVANTAGLSPTNFGDALDGSLHGYWGFEAYDGPEFLLRNVHPQQWQIAGDDRDSLIAGHDGTLHLVAEDAACVDSIMLREPSGKTEKADWKATQPNEVLVTVPLKKAKPGALTLLVKEYGSKEADAVPLQAFAPAGRLESFDLHAGDLSGVLKGSRLGDVKELTLNGVAFKPAPLASNGDSDELSLLAADPNAATKLTAGETAEAKVTLKDGRVVSLDTTIESPRPRVTLIGKSIEPAASSAPSEIQLAGQDELPQNALLTFSIHAQAPAAFTGNEKLEVATTHGSFLTTLTLTNGLTLEDSQVALATLDTGKAFGSSASGPLRFRIVEDGVAGDWQPLATLVRLPVFRAIQCKDGPSKPCKLTGSKLFLVNSIANNPQFDQAVQVPEGFPGYALTVPPPVAGQLYVKLHDDPSVVNPVVIPASELPPPPSAIPAAAPNPAAPAPASPETGSKPASSAATEPSPATAAPAPARKETAAKPVPASTPPAASPAAKPATQPAASQPPQTGNSTAAPAPSSPDKAPSIVQPQTSASQ
jgi:hypothetical protein